VHDLIAFRNEPHDRKAVLIERMTLGRALRSAKAVCAVSEATAGAVRARFGDGLPLSVVGAGPTVEEEGTWTGAGTHVLCIGTLCPRKNQLRLIEAFASLPAGVRGDATLTLVGGRGWDDDGIVRASKDTPGVSWLGFQSAEECARLLRECRGFAFVSDEEGFGLPLLDAMRVGAPVLAADIPVFRDVAGDAALYADPHDVAAIARGLETLLTADATAKRSAGASRAASFSWEKVADAVLGAARARR
jgi:glycosyltransferase involved in cell wall biosynthesis